MSEFFKNRFVQAILVSGVMTQIGIWVRNFAVLMYVVDKTNGDPFAVSMISVAEFAPIFIFSFIGGTFADRWRAKRTMVWCDLLSAVSVFGVLVALRFFSWKAVFFVTLVSAILSQFSQPSGMKLFKQHVPAEMIQTGMSMYQSIFALFMILGPVLGTFVYQHYGIDTAIAIMGVAFLLSAAALVFLPPDRVQTEEKPQTTLRQEMASGFRYVFSKKVLTMLGGCFTMAGLAVGLIQPLGVFIVTERLGLPKEYLQWFMMSNGIGMIIGLALVMALAKKAAPQKLLMFGMLVSACSMVVCGYSTVLWLTLLFQFINGMVMPCVQVGISTMMMQHTEEAFVGRVNGILNPLFTGSMVITMSVTGSLMQAFSVVTICIFAAVLFFIGLLFMLPVYGVKPPQPVSAEQ